MKKVTIGTKPTAKTGPGSPDEWVSDRLRSDEPTKRLTIDVSLSLHQRVKSQCALNGKVMADAVRELLEQNFPPPKQVESIPKETIKDESANESGGNTIL